MINYHHIGSAPAWVSALLIVVMVLLVVAFVGVIIWACIDKTKPQRYHPWIPPKDRK